MHNSQKAIYNCVKSMYDFVRGKSSDDYEDVECHVDFSSRLSIYFFTLYFIVKNGPIIKINFDSSSGCVVSSIYLDIGGIQLPFSVLDRKSQKLLRKICVFVTKKKFSERQREKKENLKCN